MCIAKKRVIFDLYRIIISIEKGNKKIDYLDVLSSSWLPQLSIFKTKQRNNNNKKTIFIIYYSPLSLSLSRKRVLSFSDAQEERLFLSFFFLLFNESKKKKKYYNYFICLVMCLCLSSSYYHFSK